MNLKDAHVRWLATAMAATALAIPATAQAKPDDLGGTIAPVGATSGGSDAGSPAATHPDNFAPRVVPSGEVTTGVSASGSDSFNWGAAGLGAVGAFALMLAAAGSVVALRQRRTKLAL